MQLLRARSFLPLIALAFPLVLVGCPGKADKPPATTSTAAASNHPGKKLYDQSCTACHGPGAKGVPNLGKDMTTSEFVKSQTDDQLVEFIKKGRTADDPANTTRVPMPPKGGNPTLSDEKLHQIVDYIRSLS